jgi:hypothetical protein
MMMATGIGALAAMTPVLAGCSGPVPVEWVRVVF